MDNQLDLFPNPQQNFTDQRLEPTVQVRLNAQCLKILRFMLVKKIGPVPNSDLNAVAYRYSARIYDLKQAGIKIQIVRRDVASGVHYYDFASPGDRERAAEAVARG